MMRILTVKQPWASLLVLGFKPVENRVWSTEYRGDVGIIASKNVDVTERARTAAVRHLNAHDLKRYESVEHCINDLPRGGIIGVGELFDVVTHMDSWWFSGPKGLLFRNMRQTKSKEGKPSMISMPGSLSMFEAHPADEKIIRAHL